MLSVQVTLWFKVLEIREKGSGEEADGSVCPSQGTSPKLARRVVNRYLDIVEERGARLL